MNLEMLFDTHKFKTFKYFYLRKKNKIIYSLHNYIIALLYSYKY